MTKKERAIESCNKAIEIVQNEINEILESQKDLEELLKIKDQLEEQKLGIIQDDEYDKEE